MNPLAVGWTVFAIVGLVVCLINLTDAWADNVILQDDTRDGLADLQAAGNVIAIDNVGREVLVAIALAACLTMGVLALGLPPPPPDPTPEQAQTRSVMTALFSGALIIIEGCLVMISVLGRVRRINVRRLLDMTLQARTEAVASGQRASIATSVAANATPEVKVVLPEEQAAMDKEREEHRQDHLIDRQEREARRDAEGQG